MLITFSSVYVDDQNKAIEFYTRQLGFEVKDDIPMGDHRWVSLVSPQAPDGVQLLLEPDAHPAAGPFKAALVADGIPVTSFAVGDVAAEHARLAANGVRFVQAPTDIGPVSVAILDDTCGNLIQIASANPDFAGFPGGVPPEA